MALIDQKAQDLQSADAAETEREVYVFPTSFAQRRLWFLSQLEPEAGAYHIAAAFDLEGRLREEALARSFDEIVQRHEILRTTFSVLDGEPVQMVALQQRFDLPVVSFAHVPPEEREAEVSRYLAAELRRPFDLHRGPLLRAGLLRLDADRHVLYYVMHHIVSDGWSEEILVRELATLYQSFAFNTAISPSGSGIGWTARCSRSWSHIGRNGSREPRASSTCRQTTRAPRCSPTGALTWASPCLLGW
jgi:NRPS condensation-like uncharacterized protein